MKQLNKMWGQLPKRNFKIVSNWNILQQKNIFPFFMLQVKLKLQIKVPLLKHLDMIVNLLLTRGWEEVTIKHLRKLGQNVAPMVLWQYHP